LILFNFKTLLTLDLADEAQSMFLKACVCCTLYLFLKISPENVHQRSMPSVGGRRKLPLLEENMDIDRPTSKDGEYFVVHIIYLQIKCTCHSMPFFKLFTNIIITSIANFVCFKG